VIIDRELVWLMGGTLGLLVVASVIGLVLRRTARSESAVATVENLNARTRAWWVMCGVFGLSVATGGVGAALFFCLTSFFALREFITITPTRQGDHRALFWTFFVITPLQYVLVSVGWYGLFSILIPVYAFLFIPARMAIVGDTTQFLERAAKTQWALMVCVYCVSHAPALLMLNIPGYAGNAKLLFFLILIVQASDVMQYVWGKTLGRHPIVPNVSPNKTLAGFLGGIASATLLGTALWWATPFTPLQAGAVSLLITLMGFAGDLTMSAIKRDSDIKDYGSMIEGHGGILDRIDSVCFAAPIFFHVTRFFFT
jgi:phosphatidate cytidylyltransferase